MIHRLLFLIFLLSIQFTTHLHAQTEVGHHIDLDGNLIEGYFDPIAYNPENSIDNIHTSNSYEQGYYYDLSGNKKKGYILYENRRIFYKKDTQYKKVKLLPEEVESIVLGTDSFFATSNFYFKGRHIESPEFVQYLTEFNGYTFAKHYHFSRGPGQLSAYNSPIVETLLVKHKSDEHWESFVESKNLKEKLLVYFGHIPILKTKINSEEFTHDDIFGIIKMAEYYDHFINSRPIYLDPYWQETKHPKHRKYRTNIVDITPEQWTIDYFKDTTKLYTIQYSNLYPFIKDGYVVAYHENGKARQITIYAENEMKNVKLYNKHGKLLKHYKYTTTENDYGYEMVKGIKFLKNNHNLTDRTVNQYPLLRKTSENNIDRSCYFNGTDTVFQVSNLNYLINIKPIIRSFNHYMENKTLNNAINDGAQGTVLISFVMNKKGYITQAIPLNTLHPEIDELLKAFLKDAVIEKFSYTPKLKPYKVNKTKQFCEFVIPFQFGINRFYRKPNYYNYHWNHFDHLNMMQTNQNAINQQIINNLR